MSIVGTRPPLVSETNLYEPHHKVRLAIKPGITGMWQVSGRSDITDFEKVVRLDKEYIENWDIGVRPHKAVKYIQLAYLTGILPIKKEKTQSALNNFDEFTMLSASNLAPYIGFTEAEVKKLSEKYQQDFAEVKRWYDGYLLKDYQVYNPRAVVSVMLRGEFRSYWSETASYILLVGINYDKKSKEHQCLIEKYVKGENRGTGVV